MGDISSAKKMQGSETAEKSRTRIGVRASLTGILCNVLLFGAKMFAGTMLHATSVMADAVNNLSDAASAVVSLVGMNMSGKPADREHPFGHGRMEYVAALTVAFLIMAIGLSFFKESVGRILHPEMLQESTEMLIILVVTIFVKLGLFIFYRRVAERIDSGIFRASSMDSLFDSVITSVTVASVAVYRMAGINIDGYAGLLVSLIIIWSGIGVIRDTLNPLLGEKMDEEMCQKITEIVSGFDEVIGIHDLIVHNYGNGRNFATIHIELPRQMSVEEGHLIADEAEEAVKKQLGVSLVAHVDPAETEDERVLRQKEQVVRLLNILDPELSLHDFSMSIDGEEKQIRFELQVPYSYDHEAEVRLTSQIMALMKEIEPESQCSIRIDRGITEEPLRI